MAEWYRASVSGVVNSGLIPSRVRPTTLKFVFTPSCLTFSIKGTVWRTSRQVYLLCRWERHLTRLSHLGVVDRWPATPKRARITLWSLSRDRRINIPLNKNQNFGITFNFFLQNSSSVIIKITLTPGSSLFLSRNSTHSEARDAIQPGWGRRNLAARPPGSGEPTGSLRIRSRGSMLCVAECSSKHEL